MICEQCGESYELAIHDNEAVHACEYEFTTILLFISRPARFKLGELPEENHQLSVDEPTGSFALTGKTGKIFESTFSIPVAKKELLDLFSNSARLAIKTAIDDALTNQVGGKI